MTECKMTDEQKQLRDEAALAWNKHVNGIENVTDDFRKGHDFAFERARVLETALDTWLAWETEQIKKDGPYVGEAINQLINAARAALKAYRGSET